MHAAHSVLSQKLLQVHVLQLEEAAVRGQVAIPQERPQELVEVPSSIPTTAAICQTVAYSTAVPHGADPQRVLVQVEPVFVCQGGKKR